MKARKSYQGLGESRAAVTPRNRLGLLPYHACAVCFGVFDHTPAGRREAVECCSEHKAGA